MDERLTIDSMQMIIDGHEISGWKNRYEEDFNPGPYIQ